MNRWKARLLVGAPVAIGLLFLSTGVASALTAEESCFTSKINGARAAAGRAPLTTDGSLVTVARRHSQRMADSGTIFHNSNLANEAPSGWQSLGENVGTGPTCDAIHQAFMNSASHRANILDPDFNFVGVGVVITSGGQIYVTEVFMQKASPPAPSTSAPTTSTPKPKATATAAPRRSAPKPAPPPPPPAPPPPPPPPGSKVPARTLAYLALLELEALPHAEERAAYAAFRQEEKADRARAKAVARERGFFSKLAALVGGLLSTSL